MKLLGLKEFAAKNLYGMSMQEAIRQGICLQCKQEALPRCYSNAGRREYLISGLCEVCFDAVFEGEED